MHELAIRVRSAITHLHPRGRRWRKFLGGFELDPDQLKHPLPAPTSRDFIICGAPRSGTTLLSAMLFQPPRVVTVMEPWAGMRLLPHELFYSIRREIEETGRLSQGKLDLRELYEHGEVRWIPETTLSYEIHTVPEYILGIKWPAFWRYIRLLPDTKFLVCIRDPKEVIASFKKTGGRLALGLGYDLAFERKLNRDLLEATRDVAHRRVLLYKAINAHLIPHLRQPNVLVVRYERWFTDRKSMMSEIGEFLGTELQEGHVRLRLSDARPPLSRREMELISESRDLIGQLGYSV